MELVISLLCAVACVCASERTLPSSILSYDTLSHRSAAVKRQAGAGPVLLDLHFRNMTLELMPSRAVFKSDVRLSAPYDPSTFHRGIVSGLPQSRVYGHVVDGLFDGVITTSEGEFHVESASKYFDDPQSFHSIVYRSVDVAYPRQSCASQAVFDRLLHTQSRSSGSSMGVRPEEEVEGGRRRKRQLDDRFCSLLVAVDHLFLASVAGNSPAAAMSEVVTIISAVRDIYSATDFDNDGTVDQIQPIIAEIRVLDGTEPGYRYGSRNIGVNDFLDLWSQEDHTGFCLALLLTYRDFADGVLGLAWVAEPPPGNRGGICEERVNLPSGVRSLNTAITSLLNFGVRQPRPVTIITVAHEFGHNFGSPHDSTSMPQCTPGAGAGGNYIMFSQATDGSQSNNNDFSPCSRQSINSVLQSSRSDCFTADGAFCGNGVVEAEEECDCGSRCDSLSCCTSDCTLTPGSVCSPPELCCIDQCEFAEAALVCRNTTQCGEASQCTGNSSTCPAQRQRPDQTLCNNGQNVCVEGDCVGSLCTTVGLEECQCSEEPLRCHICCTLRDQCVSSINSNLGFPGEFIEAGRACSNFQGYCSQEHNCITIDNEDLLDDLRNIFTLNTLNKIVAFLSVYWYVPVIVVVALAVLILLLHFTYRKRKPIQRRLSSVRRGSVRRGGGASQTDSAPSHSSSSSNAPREISQREALVRLRRFFPTAEADTMTGVLQVSRTESKAVRRLLDLGYPLRRLPIPQA